MTLAPLDLTEARFDLVRTRAKEAVVRVQAASPVLFLDQYGGSDPGFRRISRSTSGRDMAPGVFERMQRLGHYLYKSNPIAFRAVELMVDFVVGEGITVEAEDEAVQAVIDRFWKFNKMDRRVRGWVRGLSIFGEQVPFCAVNPVNGLVRVAYLDPFWVESVEHGTLEALPGKAVTGPQAVILRRSAAEREAQRLRIVQREEDGLSDDYGRLHGECFYWSINSDEGATRGVSDMFCKIDYVRKYDDMLWAMVNRAEAQSDVVWDVELTGATDEQIVEWIKTHGKLPKGRTMRVHNEGAKWTAVSPALGNAAETVTGAQAIKNMILAGYGFPEHWFGEGGDVNRATALEMGDPAYKMLTSRQLYMRQSLADLIDYVIDSAVAAGVLDESVNREFAVKTPELSVKDLGKAATALQATVTAVSTAIADGLMDKQTGCEMILLVASQLGVEADAKDVLEKAQKEEAERRAQDYRNRPALPSGDDPDDMPGGAREPEMEGAHA